MLREEKISGQAGSIEAFEAAYKELPVMQLLKILSHHSRMGSRSCNPVLLLVLVMCFTYSFITVG